MVKHTLYIQMQFCSQKTLADFLSNEEARKGLSASQGDSIDIPYALSLFLQIAQGVKHVHNQGLIHRDLKPENILCCENLENLKIADFGISMDLEAFKKENSNSNQTPKCMNGTADYMAPEQINFDEITLINI